MAQIETLDVSSRELRQYVELWPLLRALREWKFYKEGKYTIEDGWNLYAQKVCTPKKYQKMVPYLHMVNMKALARSYAYWKDIDRDC